MYRNKSSWHQLCRSSSSYLIKLVLQFVDTLTELFNLMVGTLRKEHGNLAVPEGKKSYIGGV